jgi:hypothetical protein
MLRKMYGKIRNLWQAYQLKLLEGYNTHTDSISMESKYKGKTWLNAAT